MKKILVRVLSVTSVLAFAATVAAAEAPRARATSQDEGAGTLSCTKSGMTCGSNNQCCSKSCTKPSGRTVGRCD